MAEAIAFWAAALAVAALALPLAFRLFARFPDGGAGLALALGLTLVSAGYFLLRVIGALPAGRGGVLLALALFAAAMAALAIRDRRARATFIRARRGLALAAALFTLLFFACAFFRSHAPDVADVPELPMNLAFLNALLVSPDYPPHDPWMAGERLSYYYGGHLRAAILTSASGASAAAGYNLALAAVFASAGTAAASLCAALARWLFGGRARRWIAASAALGVVLLLFSGSLLGPFQLAAAHGAAPQGVFEAFGIEAFLPDAPPARSATWYPDGYWFWWRVSRLVPDTITAFPAYSFVLGDLHAHVMAIPAALLAIAIAASLWRGRGALSWRDHRRRPIPLVAVALVFGGLAFVNTWDAVTFAAILAAAVVARNLRAGSPRATPQPPARRALRAGGDALSWLLPPAAIAAVAYAPWYAAFSSAASGIHAYAGAGTRIEHLFLQFGVPILLALPVLGWAFARKTPPSRTLALALLAPGIPLALWLTLAAARGDLSPALDARGAGGWATLAFHAVAVWLLAAAALLLARRRHPATFVAGLVALGILVLYGVELFFIGDNYLNYLPRFNTFYKVSVQARIVLSVAATVAAVAALRAANPRARPLLFASIGALLAASLVYAVIAVPNRADGFARNRGFDYVARADSSEHALVHWLAGNAAGDAVVVEATGRRWERGDDGLPRLSDRQPRIEYGAVNRISVNTGLQAPFGWPGHQLQWRGGDARPEITRRQNLVDRVYTAPGAEEALAALRELGATYVVVGSLERERYADGLMPPFATFLDTVFVLGETRVHRVPVAELAATR